MFSKPRRCLDCDYTWSRYLDFLSCPKCGTNVLEAKVGRRCVAPTPPLPFWYLSAFTGSSRD